MRASLSFLGIDVGDSLAATCEDEVNAAATRAPINYVSKVQEYCDKNLWPPPTYEFSECSQSLFGGKYQCKVRLWRWEFSGFGSSKKEAKRKAATEFLKEVVEQGLTIPTDALEAMEEENLPLVEKQDLNKLKVKQSSQEMASRMARKILSGLHTVNGRVKEVNVEELNSPTFDVYDVLKRTLEENKLGVFYSYTTNTKSGETPPALLDCSISGSPSHPLLHNSRQNLLPGTVFHDSSPRDMQPTQCDHRRGKKGRSLPLPRLPGHNDKAQPHPS